MTEFGEVTPDNGFMWDDEDCPLSQSFMDDLNGIDTLLDKGTSINVPWLLIHGTEDDVVLIDDTHDIHEKLENCTKLIIEGADHVFSDAEHMKLMVNGAVNGCRDEKKYLIIFFFFIFFRFVTTQVG